MKKLVLCLFFACIYVFSSSSNAQTTFSKALLNCDNYSQEGTIPYNGEIFHILVTLDKNKNKTCTYKERITQGKDYQQLTCSFDFDHLSAMSDSMSRYSEMFKKEMAKNRIFEAKMTSNGEVLQKYLANPKYCQITHSKN